MIRLILIDIDGTLLGNDGVHATTWPALAAAHARGVRVGLCTGRLGTGLALEFARRVSPLGLHIFQSGAVVSRAGEPAAFASPIAPADVAGLLAISRREHEPIEAYTERGFFLEHHTELTRVHAHHLGMEPVIGDLAAIVDPIVRLQWVVAGRDWPRFQVFTAAFAGIEANPATAPWSPGTIFSNLTRTGTSKSSAMRWLASHLGITMREVAMIGDGENDRGAIEAAGLGVAVGNASDRVKAAASRVVAAADAGGVAEAIRLALGGQATT